MANRSRSHIDSLTRRWIRGPADERAAHNGCRFDESRAQYVIDWIEQYCVLYEGEWAGEPLILQDWQLDVVSRLFGWVRYSERWGREVRRFRQASIWVAKKNGKSPTLAALGLYLLAGDGEQGQSVYFGARDGSQAREIVGKHAIQMLTQSDALMAECNINMTTMQISHLPTRSIMKPLSSANSRTQKSKEGLNGSILIDETHVVDRKFVNRVDRAGISRSEPLMIEVSTAGDDPTSYGAERFDHAQRVESGERTDEELFIAIYAAPQDLSDADLAADPLKYGKMANPTMGRIVDPEEFVRDYERSRVSLPKLAKFKQYRLDIWSNTATPWINPNDWKRCYREFTQEDLLGRPCVASLDLSRTRDTTALVLEFPGLVERDEDPEEVFLLPYFWLPRATAESENHLVPWMEWAEEGHINLVDGEVISYEPLKSLFRELSEQFSILEVVFDPKFAEEVTQWMEEQCNVTRRSFTAKWDTIGPATDEFERRIIAGKLHHNGHKVLTWQVQHTRVKHSFSGLKWPTKPGNRSDHRRIDGTTSGVMGLARLMQMNVEDTEGSSYYDLPDEERASSFISLGR